MSNVIKSSIAFSNSEQPGVVGKIYEELKRDSAGNVTVRYYRVVKAGSAISAGDLVGCVAANYEEMVNTGQVVPIAADDAADFLAYGICETAIASGEYGFAVCRGAVTCQSLASGSEGSPLASYGSSGSAGQMAATSATNNTVIGVRLESATTAYISLI
tara:strand:+ start:590 stop:1066 length:477 start_codon:yes stop_codon:yes gene_type:complete